MASARLSIAALLVLSVSAPAQIVTGSIAGSIKDPTGLAVPAAHIVLHQAATGMERKTEANAHGDFVFGALNAGEYTLSATATGFKTTEKKDVALTTGERLTLGDITLQLGAVSEVISVTALAAAVQTQSAERADLITSKQVQDLLVRGRNVTDLLQLVPGIVVASQSDDLSSESNFYVQGNRRTMNNVSIDGVPATDMGNGYALKLSVSQDAVSEVRVLVSNYQAEYGRMSGSNLQIVTKSGTRQFHGLGSYFKRHEQFNANSFFNNRNGTPVPRYRYNTWAYNVGGPIYIPGKFNKNRDKLFFFWQQEFWPTRFGYTGRVTVPTALEREGNYSQSLDLNNKLISLKDPFNGGAPFPGNIIPASRVDANGRALLKFFPLPNFFDRSISAGQYNYNFNGDSDSPKKTSTLKMDYNINASNTLVGNFGVYDEDATGAFGINTVSANWPQIRKSRWSHSKSIGARYTRIFSPTVLNEFAFGFLTQPAQNSYNEEDLRTNQRDTIGFKAEQFSPSSNPQNIVPNATFGGVPTAATIDTEGRFPLYNVYRLFNWSDNVTVTRGQHNFKAGVYIEHFFRHQKKAVNFTGSFDFGRNVNNPLDTNYAYANAALGVFNSYTEPTGLGWMKVNTGGFEAFVQDNWKVTRRLTLDYGMRMYWLSPITEQDNKLSGFVRELYDPAKRVQLIQPALNAQGKRIGVHPVTGATYAEAQIGAIAPGVGDPSNGIVVAGDNGYPRALVENRGIQWGPRVGFAYDVAGNGKTAIRGGFGIFYNRYFTEVFANNFVAQAPLVQNPVISYGQVSNLLSSSGLLYPGNMFGADRAGNLPTVMNFSFSVQRNLGAGTVVDAAYSGSVGRHLLWRRDTNPIPLGSNFNPANADPTQKGKPLPAAFLRPTVGYNNINIIEGASSSNYHSLQVSAKRRFARGLQFGLAWTWSKTMDFNDTDNENLNNLMPLRVWNYGLASFDRTHVATLNYLWDVPSVRSHNPVVRTALGNWQISGITRFVSGAPVAVGYSTTTAVDVTGTSSLAARVVVTDNPVLSKGERTFSRNFRTEVFKMPAVGTVGNAAKNQFRGPGVNNWDVAIFKNFPIREQMRMQFRWELYNVFNHTQFSGLDATARFDPATGEQVNRRFGEFTGARDPRQMQLALRFYF